MGIVFLAFHMDPFPKEKLESGFSLDRLRSLLAVYEAGYIAKASGGDRTRANQISRQISELEAFFGVTLRSKEGRQAVLTPEGEKLALLTKEFYRTVQAYQDEMEGLPGTMELGAGSAIIETLLIPKIKELKKAADGAIIRLRNRRTGQIVEQLLSGDLDIGIIPGSQIAGKLESKPLGMVSFELFVPVALSGGALPGNPMAAIEKFPYASIDGSGEIRTAIQSEASAKGTILRPELECSGYSMVASAIQGGDYCGILPNYYSSRFEEGEVTQIKLPGLKKLQRKYVAAWPQSSVRVKEKSLSGMVGFLKQVFKEV